MFNDGKKKNKIDVDNGINVDDIVVDVDVRERPKNRKQIRLEKKEAKKKAVLSISSSSSPESLTLASKNHEHNNNEMIEKSEYRRLKKIQQKEFRKGQEKMMRNEIREEKKIRKRKKLHREMNAKGGAAAAAASKKRKKATRNTDNSVNEERDVSINVFQSVFHGNNNNVNGSAAGSSGGITTTRLGVQYEDVVIGKGKVLSEGVPVTVKYELTGGQFGVVIDSSKSFQFRLGMGEVIQGWDIGLEGIKVGGRRKLRVPPKAGYFGKDIGAGPGAMLNFDISVIACGNL
mmetsp:Transcript_4881/g.5436  ORF Transcript_4881/g.5436 Transcript_4881/m.5436 type:complete len:289 (-) Transcript_4881:69-935(-)